MTQPIHRSAAGRVRVPVGMIVTILLALLPESAGVSAQTSISVTASTDELTDNGDCSLREAIRLTNGLAVDPACGIDTGAPYTISLQSGVSYGLSIAGASENDAETGDLDVKGQVSIVLDGAGSAVIDGGNLDRIFHVHPGGYLALTNINVINGFAPGGLSEGGGGIRNEGTLALVDAEVAENEVAADPEGTTISPGGGIFNSGTLTMERGGLDNNDAAGGQISSDGRGGALYVASGNVEMSHVSHISFNGAGFSGRGGGIYIEGGSVTLTATVVHGNSAANGGGIFNNGELSITGSLMESNDARGRGGGIHNLGSLTITGTTVSKNGSGPTDGRGGGIYNGAVLELTNSTISGNAGFGTGGGGIFNDASMELSNVTVSNNSFFGDGGSGIYSSAGTTTVLVNTILANNINGAGPVPSADCFGTVTSKGHNLIESTNSCTIVGGGVGDVFGQDPGLGALSDNGGPPFIHPTLTHALEPGSPALDAGDNAVCAAEPVNGMDQRGVFRPQDGDSDGTAVCDIGAFELAFEIPVECAGMSFDNTIFGTASDDELEGTNGNDLIFGFAGDDRIDGNNGSDCILGGPGSDHLEGSNGSDVLLGAEGNDRLDGGNGDDHIYGGDDEDLLLGGRGSDVLFGGGDDTLFGGNGADALDGEEGIDVLDGGNGGDSCSGEALANCE